MIKNTRKVLIAFYLTSAFAIFAHPHMKLESRVQLDFDGDKIIGFYSEWELDKFFSSDILLGYDYDGNKSFDSAENKDVFNNAFISLKDYNFFTYIRVGNKRVSPESVSDFSVKVTPENNVVYRFYTSLKDIDSRDFYISIYDFSYYCVCVYKDKKTITDINNSNNIKYKTKIEKNENYPVFYDPYAPPGDLTIYTKMKPGLEEAIIKEIHVTY